MRIERGELCYLEPLTDLFNAYRIVNNKPSDLPACKHFLFDRLSRNDSVIFIALTETDTLTGFVQLYPSFSSLALKPLWMLSDIYVLPEYRRQGIGLALLNAAKNWAEEYESCKLTVEVDQHNPQAQALYEQFGFHRDTEIINYQFTNQQNWTALSRKQEAQSV